MQTQLDWSAFPRQCRRPRLAALLLALVVVAAAARQFVLDWQRILDLRPVELRLAAGLPEMGGWKGGPLRVASGRAVRLTVESIAGTHSFALAHTDIRSRQPLGPGEAETVEFLAPAPGRYVLYCTTWCSPNHWRMRTVLEVFDPADPESPVAYPQDPLRYQLIFDALPLDSAHGMEAHPGKARGEGDTAGAEHANLATGATLWRQLAPSQKPLALLERWGWPAVTPQEAYDHLSRGDAAGLEAAADLSESDRWSLVAYLWQQAATTESLTRGAELFRQDCADCHGESGQGDGIAAPFSPAQEPDFTDLAQAGARSPAVYYAKIARGGMGTGMPNWGTIHGEDDLWSLTIYLQSFMFDNVPEE